jgi:hypothetical protein
VKAHLFGQGVGHRSQRRTSSPHIGMSGRCAASRSYPRRSQCQPRIIPSMAASRCVTTSSESTR